MTVLPEWVTLSESSRHTTLVDIASETSPCFQEKDLVSLEMPYPENIMAYSNRFQLPSPTIVTQMGLPDSFSSPVLAGDMTQRRESFVGLLSRMHGQAHFETDYSSWNSATDAGIEYPDHLSSVNFSPIGSDGQTLSILAADKSRDSLEVVEGGVNLVDLYNADMQQHEQFYKKIRLSTLRSQIRGSGGFACVCSGFDEHYKQGQFDLNEYPPQKLTKRKKHRPKVLRELRPARNFNGRKKWAQTTKEKTAADDRECNSVHDMFPSKPNMQVNLGSICTSCEVSISGVHSCVALKKCGNNGFDSWQTSSCFGGSLYLDRSSDFQSLPSAARDQNRESFLSSQEEGPLSCLFSNEDFMSGSLCAGFHTMHEQNCNSSSSRAELDLTGKIGGVAREEGLELSLQLKEWTVEPQTSSISCSQMEIEQSKYPWSTNDRMRSMPWLYETQSANINRNSHSCMPNMVIDLENESLFSNNVPNIDTSEDVPYYDLVGGVSKSWLNSYLQTVDSWKDSTSQNFSFNCGPHIHREDSLCCNNYSNLLQTHPSSVYKPESEVSSISSITNPTQLDGQGRQLLDSNCLQIVPYQNKEIVLSKRGREKHRPKVQLDTETNRVWSLLENGAALPPEDDQEKARMWAKERAVMEERVDYFITRMHDVQGDRRFSLWKGSLVDSVVGAFLTQNVSDHLSSSAFMSLASKFPASPRNGAYDLQETKNMDQSPVVRASNIEPLIHETMRTDGQSVALEMMRIGDQSIMVQCPVKGKFMVTESMRMDMIECKFKNDEPISHDVRTSTSITFDDPCITNPSQYSPLPLHPFSGSRTSINEKVRRRLDFVKNDSSGKQHQAPPVLRNDSISSCDEQTIQSEENCDYMENNLVLLSKEQKTYPETEAALLVNDKACLKSLSQLQTVQAPDSVILAPDKGKKKLYQVSRISGIERAHIEVSQGGHKNRRKDWESMRQRVLGISHDGTSDSMSDQGTGSRQQDAVNWEAVRLADIANVADAIKERGMHNILSGRIKAFLTRLHEEHGSLNIEWVKGLSVEDAREYLLDIRGLGIKSVECIRLLTLQHLAFPVDTNVGRICVRLGWVPIEPLPEELQLHLLELYPIQETIQKYLWPRLCTLDQRTLYELHYQMITFGKVFCTKSKPNCNSCPMRGECKHFASAYASSKLSLTFTSSATHPVDLPALPGTDAEKQATSIIEHRELQQTFQQIQICEPIIEEPATPDHECTLDMSDIEDSHSIYSKHSDYSDPDYLENFALIELPSEEKQFQVLGEQERLAIQYQGSCCSSTTSEGHIYLSQSFASDLTSEGPSCQSQSTVSDLTSERDSIHSGISVMEFTSGKDLHESQSIIPDMPSNAIVPLPLECAYLPVPKLKNVGRLRTVHYVYEIPDGHHLIREMDNREKDDPCFYLLAIWSPDEVPQSQDEIDNCCKQDFCMSPCRTALGQDESVKGTLLIPCRTAMHGSFPLNGTFFQVNEVFADHKSSLYPLEVPRTWLWNLRRRFVYFGTSIPSIFRGLSTEEIKLCFWRGYVCVRGFDRESRAPKPLVARLHFPASKQMKVPKKSDKKGAS